MHRNLRRALALAAIGTAVLPPTLAQGSGSSPQRLIAFGRQGWFWHVQDHDAPQATAVQIAQVQ